MSADSTSSAILSAQQQQFTHTVQLKGVSFNNDITGESRQDLLKCTNRGDPVLCIKEPDNPVDPCAVRVVSTKVLCLENLSAVTYFDMLSFRVEPPAHARCR